MAVDSHMNLQLENSEKYINEEFFYMYIRKYGFIYISLYKLSMCLFTYMFIYKCRFIDGCRFLYESTIREH
jgi:hypothetical protein